VYPIYFFTATSLDRDHFDGGDGSLEPFVACLHAGASSACSSVSQVSTPNACGTPVSCCDWPMPRATRCRWPRSEPSRAQQAAQRQDRIAGLVFGESARGGRNLPCAGYANDLDIGPDRNHCAAVRRARPATGGRYYGVPACDHNRKFHSRGAQVAFDSDRLAVERIFRLQNPSVRVPSNVTVNSRDFQCVGAALESSWATSSVR